MYDPDELTDRRTEAGHEESGGGGGPEQITGFWLPQTDAPQRPGQETGIETGPSVSGNARQGADLQVPQRFLRIPAMDLTFVGHASTPARLVGIFLCLPRYPSHHQVTRTNDEDQFE